MCINWLLSSIKAHIIKDNCEGQFFIRIIVLTWILSIIQYGIIWMNYSCIDVNFIHTLLQKRGVIH
jgi:hypothetical protein